MYVIFYFIEQVNFQENPHDSIKDSSESSNELPLLFFMIFSICYMNPCCCHQKEKSSTIFKKLAVNFLLEFFCID